MECAFTSLVRTECGMFVLYCMLCLCPCQLFCSAWMWCLEEVYKCNCDMFSVGYMYLNHLKFCVVCIDGQRYVCCSECNVVSNECYDGPQTYVSTVCA